MDHHLDAGEGDGNRRNSYGRKTVLTGTGKIALDIPRDRLSSFDPRLIAKYQRRFPGFDDKIVSMYARGMSTREIQGHLRELYTGSTSRPDLVSAVTDAVLEEVAEWQNRPLEALYALIFFAAIRITVRDEGRSGTRPFTSPSVSGRKSTGRVATKTFTGPHWPNITALQPVPRGWLASTVLHRRQPARITTSPTTIARSDLMSKIERDLRTRLDWVTVDHFDTGHPHTRGATWLDRQLVRKDRSASAV